MGLLAILSAAELAESVAAVSFSKVNISTMPILAVENKVFEHAAIAIVIVMAEDNWVVLVIIEVI